MVSSETFKKESWEACLLHKRSRHMPMNVRNLVKKPSSSKKRLSCLLSNIYNPYCDEFKMLLSYLAVNVSSRF